ncbi:hypothetical protein [Kribbella sp. CA-294648]|uniref:hypothetical protein n=1 Tax=Kribbella sp. CA-294648 TaxID=3239948 RepID=UPI003D9261A9
MGDDAERGASSEPPDAQPEESADVGALEPLPNSARRWAGIAGSIMIMGGLAGAFMSVSAVAVAFLLCLGAAFTYIAITGAQIRDMSLAGNKVAFALVRKIVKNEDAPAAVRRDAIDVLKQVSPQLPARERRAVDHEVQAASDALEYERVVRQRLASMLGMPAAVPPEGMYEMGYLNPAGVRTLVWVKYRAEGMGVSDLNRTYAEILARTTLLMPGDGRVRSVLVVNRITNAALTHAIEFSTIEMPFYVVQWRNALDDAVLRETIFAADEVT